jgi:HAD superfamily hydrolase (TIGR01509 family)
VVESSGLLNRRRGLNLYRGFESPPLRQNHSQNFASRTMIATKPRPLAVVFDLDGVLVDSAPSHNSAFQEIFAPFGITEFDYSEFAGWKTSNVVETVLKRAGYDLSPPELTALASKKSRTAREKLIESNPVAPDCVSVLRRLSNSYLLGLASSGSRESVSLFLNTNSCESFFSSVLCGDDVSRAKPDPEIYCRTFASLRVSPERVVVIEDAVSGVVAAKAAGAGFVIGLEGTCPASKLCDAGADTFILAVRDLPDFLSDAYDSAISSKT